MHMELEKLKALLGIPQEDNSKDTALVFVMDQVEEIILNYCCVAEVPRGLLHTAYRMAMDIYRAESVGEAEPVTVTSITEGDTSTSFGRSGFMQAIQGTILKDYKAQLNCYRRLRRG